MRFCCRIVNEAWMMSLLYFHALRWEQDRSCGSRECEREVAPVQGIGKVGKGITDRANTAASRTGPLPLGCQEEDTVDLERLPPPDFWN